MAHIPVPANIPGIVGPMMAYPETAKPMNALAEVLLCKESPTFSKADRELVASYVSFLNQCIFCSESHGAVADHHAKKPNWARQVWDNPEKAGVSERTRALLAVAAKVQKDARTVTAEDMNKARSLGATDHDLHDTVLIAAAFCMFNRYVDGLGTMAPPRQSPAYLEMGAMLAERGYIRAIPENA